MLSHEFDFVINMFEKAASTEDYGRGMGACRFFSVCDVSKLVKLLGKNDLGFVKPDGGGCSMSFPVDDIGLLCVSIIRDALFNMKVST